MNFKKSKLYNWEFWPMWLFYLPVYAIYLWYCLRARHMVFFSAANPVMEMGGLVDYSKWNVLKRLSAQLLPKTLYLERFTSSAEINVSLELEGIQFPLIAKPDKGERGYGVQKINNSEELLRYLNHGHFPILLQEFIDTPLEFGVMYHRFPSHVKGQITSIVQKQFLHVVGDGLSTLSELMAKDLRASLQIDRLTSEFGERLGEVVPQDEIVLLEPIGNHCRGTAFLNANHLINDQLMRTFDHIAFQIEGFHFGRFDLRVDSLEDLYEGKVKIMEINGANSEPAHIYDPNMRIMEAYRHLFRHWKVLFRISKENHRKGAKYMPFKEAYSKFKGYFRSRELLASKNQVNHTTSEVL